MKKAVITLVSLIFIITCPAAGFGGSSKTRQVTGNVTSIDTVSNTITVKKKDREVTLNVEEKTRIIQCINKTAITDIKIGDKVTTKYAETPGKNTAKSVTIRESDD